MSSVHKAGCREDNMNYIIILLGNLFGQQILPVVYPVVFPND